MVVIHNYVTVLNHRIHLVHSLEFEFRNDPLDPIKRVSTMVNQDVDKLDPREEKVVNVGVPVDKANVLGDNHTNVNGVGDVRVEVRIGVTG